METRTLFEWQFEGGGVVFVRISGDVATEKAIDWLEKMIELKRKELQEARAQQREEPMLDASAGV